jgi:hypothetical protein
MSEASEKDKAEARRNSAYRVAVMANDTILGKGTFEALSANNEALGRNMIKTDLGIFNEPSSLMLGDDLDAQTRDRLISNSREDIAATFAHAKDAFKMAYQTRAIARRTALLTWVILIINLTILLVLL